MGSGRWDDTRYAAFSNSTIGKRTEDIYKERAINNKLDPKGVKVRESRDSHDNPESTPIIVALDVTGSMGMIADHIAREGLGTLFKNILDRKPVTDPHLMFMGVGDVDHDRAPLQVSQFEADHRIIEQLTQIYLEHGGGGNNHESYSFPWYFAAFHTVHDAMEKRRQRGFLFTIGDEETPGPLTKEHIKKFLDEDVQVPSFDAKTLLEYVNRVYNTYHIVIEEGNYAQGHRGSVMSAWTNLMGQHVIPLSDYKLLPETIVSILEVARGDDAVDVTDRWSGRAKSVVHEAIKQLPKGHGGPIARTA